MCLRKITKKIKKNDKTEIWYKVMKLPKSPNKNAPVPVYMGTYRNIYFQMGLRYQEPANRNMITIGSKLKYPTRTIKNSTTGKTRKVTDYSRKPTRIAGAKYKSGYHFYSLEGAKSMINKNGRWGHRVIVECAVTDIRVLGEDRFGEACVAQAFTPIREIPYKSPTKDRRM